MAVKSCIEVNRPDKVYFHYEHLPYGKWWDEIKGSLTLHPIEKDQAMAAYRYKDSSIEKYRYAHLSDISRLEILLEYGGVYADIDTIFVKPIPEELYQHACVMGREKVDESVPAAKEAGGSLCNAFIMAEKNARFIRLWLDRIFDEFDGSWSAHSTFLPYRISREYPETIHVEPERSFFYLDWTREGIRSLFNKKVELPEDVYSLHLWSHLWWEKGRMDFTFFHEGRLTPNFIKYGNSTYSALAKSFLPADTECSQEAYRAEARKASTENIKLFLGRLKGKPHA
ncbi:glycosyltransferase [Paenibacillus pinistramenti]|uniref:glycosyltransferase n=1 Tax=Paenibacillus pinistramenti TaxID=1768003 RepID=UPI0013969582|nr:glycosyltransferase [Paenibacillus pinistramenti]